MKKVVPILILSLSVVFAKSFVFESQNPAVNKVFVKTDYSHFTFGGGGPDSFGYRWIDSDTTAPNAPTFNWIDISAVGTQVTGLGDDNVVGPFPIGFNFPYYWYKVSSFYVGSNGYIAFGDRTLAASPFNDDAPPNPNRPNNMVAPLLSDLDFSVGEPRCYYWTNATNDTCIITYQNVRWWNVATSCCSLQIILSKPDSSITFQYKRIIGQPWGGWSTQYNATGIENIIGNDGLRYLWGTTPAGNELHDNLAVKFYPPAYTTYQAFDISIYNALSENSGGVHLLVNTPHTLWANVFNSGNQPLTACSVFCRVLNEANEVVFADTVEIASMSPGDIDSVAFQPDWTPTVIGVYRSIFKAKINNDIYHGNDSVVVETRVVDYPTELAFDDGEVDARYNWQGWGGGYGIKFTPPVYPCRITGAKAHLSINGTNPITCTIYVFKDDGPNGSPGTILARRNITVNSTTPKWYYLTMDQTITEGSFYVGVISSDSAEPSYSMDSDAPISGQTWEYTGVWAPYRDYAAEDVMMRAIIGYEPLENDVSVEELVAPTTMVTPGATITPRALIRNWGTANQPNIPVYMKIDSCGINVYSGYGSIALNSGDEDYVDFSPAWTAGPAYNGYDITVYTALAGDQNPSNDTIYGLTSSFVITRNYYANFRGVTPTIDGNVGEYEWADALRYDVSDVNGYGTGIPHRPGSAYMWVKHDSTTVYFAVTMPYAAEANNGDQLGLYIDENRNGQWQTDSSEGNYWIVNYETGGVDSVIYRALLPTSPLTTWRYGHVSNAQVSCNLTNSYMHFECAIPKGTDRQYLNCNPVRDTMRFWMFALDRPDDIYYGWWPQDVQPGSWYQPMAYGILFLRDKYYDVGVTEILEPTGTIYTGTAVTPKVIVKNYGLATPTFPVILTITEQKQFLAETVYISLDLAQEDTVEFSSFMPSLGLYQVEAKVAMTDDANASNNLRTTSFEVITPPPGQWIQKEAIETAVPKAIKDGGALVGVGNELYAFVGTKTNKFKKYTIGSGWSYTETESLPFGYKYPISDPPSINKKFPGKGAALCYDGVNTIYATRGNGTREFWSFNLTTSTWTREESIPVPKGVKGGTALAFYDGKVYLLAGAQKKTDVNNFYVFDTITRHWSASVSLELGSYIKVWKDGSCLAVCNGLIYALKGGDKNNLFYAFDGSAWSAKETLPMVDTVFGRAKAKVLVKDGGCMASDGNVIYAVKGGATDCFWRYTPSSGIWQRLESIPVIDKKHAPKTGAAMAYAQGKVWLLVGNKQPDFWCYTPGVEKSTAVTNLAIMTEKTFPNLQFNLSAIPNPFTKTAHISYTVPMASKVSIKLYNATGSLIKTMVDNYQDAGIYSLSLTGLTNGVYFLKYQDANHRKEIKLIVQ